MSNKIETREPERSAVQATVDRDRRQVSVWYSALDHPRSQTRLGQLVQG